MSDIGEMVYLPPLLAALRAEAPAHSIEVLQVNFENTVRAAGGRAGDFDMATYLGWRRRR